MEMKPLYDLIDFFVAQIRLSDAAFQNLLGLLFVLVVSRLLLPLHKLMSEELKNRNEIVDLAEKDGCTEFDVFLMAQEQYDGRQNKKKAERDFSSYLCNWPENYVHPYYIRLYLEMRNKSEQSSIT
jgi:hypothetical protein